MLYGTHSIVFLPAEKKELKKEKLKKENEIDINQYDQRYIVVLQPEKGRGKWSRHILKTITMINNTHSNVLFQE